MVTRAPGYQVMPGPGELDADRFAALVAEGRQALARCAPELAAVDLLDEAVGTVARAARWPTCPRRRWWRRRRTGWKSRGSSALELRAEANLACGRHAEAVPEVRQAARRPPAAGEAVGAADPRAVRGRPAGRGAGGATSRPGRGSRRSLASTRAPSCASSTSRYWPPTASRIWSAGPAGTGAGAAPPPVPAQLPADIPTSPAGPGRWSSCANCWPAARWPRQPRGGPGGACGGLGRAGQDRARGARGAPAARRVPRRAAVRQPARRHPARRPGRGAGQVPAGPGRGRRRIPLGRRGACGAFPDQARRAAVLVVLDDARGTEQVRPLLPGSASCAVLITTRNWLPELAGSAVLDLDVLSADEAGAVHQDRRRASAWLPSRPPPTRCSPPARACRWPSGSPAPGWPPAATGASAPSRTGSPTSGSRLDELRVGNLAVRASFEVSFASLPGPATPGGAGPGAGVPPAGPVDRAVDQPARRVRLAW